MKKPLIILVLGFLLIGAACSKKTTNTNALTNLSNTNTVNQENTVTESGCAQEGSIKSPGSLNEATITFDNQTAGDLKVYWINFDGDRVFYSDLKANSTLDQATWVGHVWVVADGADQCVKLHSANAVQQTLTIEP